MQNYKLIRSKRKTLAIEISNDAKLIVRSPEKLSIKRIECFISEKQNWINKKINQILDTNKKITFNFQDNEKHLFLGEKYPIKLVEKQNKELILFQNIFYLDTSVKNPKNIFINWYISQAKKHITKKVDFFAKSHNLNYQKVKINKAKTRWGSCSYINNLNFNYRLILAPEFVIDYVVIHELAHTIHKNHSKDFWELVSIIMPNYNVAKKWLKNNGNSIINI